MLLELRKNFICLGVLDSEGYMFIGQGGVLKVSKGAQRARLVAKGYSQVEVLTFMRFFHQL